MMPFTERTPTAEMMGYVPGLRRVLGHAPWVVPSLAGDTADVHRTTRLCKRLPSLSDTRDDGVPGSIPRVCSTFWRTSRGRHPSAHGGATDVLRLLVRDRTSALPHAERPMGAIVLAPASVDSQRRSTTPLSRQPLIADRRLSVLGRSSATEEAARSGSPR